MKSLIRYYTIASLAILILGAIWVGVSAVDTSTLKNDQLQAARQGFVAPDFELQDANGSPVKLSDQIGSVVIVNFWTSWCPPCKAEMPAIQKIQSAFEDEGLRVLAVNMTRQDNPGVVEEFIQKYQLTMTVLMDQEGSVEKAYRVEALPTTYFIGKDGIIRKVIIGGPLPEALLYAEVLELLKEDH